MTFWEVIRGLGGKFSEILAPPMLPGCIFSSNFSRVEAHRSLWIRVGGRFRSVRCCLLSAGFLA